MHVLEANGWTGCGYRGNPKYAATWPHRVTTRRNLPSLGDRRNCSLYSSWRGNKSEWFADGDDRSFICWWASPSN